MRSEGHQFDKQCFNWGKACMALRLEMWCVTPTKSYRSTVNSLYKTIDRPFLVEGVYNGWSLRYNFAWRSETTARTLQIEQKAYVLELTRSTIIRCWRHFEEVINRWLTMLDTETKHYRHRCQIAKLKGLLKQDRRLTLINCMTA
jgi:hypothetical protein